MLAKIVAHGYLRLSGWTFKNQMPPEIRQCVLIAAPHTSNWDALYTKLGFMVMGIPAKLTIKDSYMRFPYGPAIRAMGGIGINRRAKKEGEHRPSMVQAMADLFKQHKELIMLVTPEGTRSLRTEWKTGFYHVAKLAGVPIALAYVDYPKKEIGIDRIIYPSDDMARDMKEIMDFYKNIQGKHPHNFSVDTKYLDQ
jgi:1-acyl-sn-glycerol-3-phosphate acyltransferase